MPILYIDNFRGFQKTFLPLKEVNFFVGENSTGKTSVLKLVKLLSSQQFWFDLQFDSEEMDLGFYSEIVSKNSENQSYFEVGIVGDSFDKKSRISAILLRFINVNGIPRVSEIRMIDKNTEVFVKVEDNNYKFAFKDIDLTEVNDSNKLQYFRIWIEKNTISKDDFNKEEFPVGFPVIIWIKTHIYRKLSESKKNPENINLDLPHFLYDLTWLAPIRAEPQRTYDKHKLSFSPEGSHAPYILKEMLSKSTEQKKRITKILNRFGKDSGLFKKIDTVSLRDDDTAPFELHIYLDKKPIKISNVGYGVSQILPLIIEVIRSDYDGWFAIQQPEIHLHPKSQAAFGELIFKSFSNENKKFIIETHSDYMIDRFRLRTKKEYQNKRKEREIFQVVFFERIEGRNKLSTININNDGSYSSTQPKKFKDFFIKEQLDLIDL